MAIEREYYDLGEEPPFRPSKDRCQNLVMALLLCDGKIHDSFSLDIDRFYHDNLRGQPKCGDVRYGMKPGNIAILMRISLAKGMKADFERIMGCPCLTDPPQVHLNLRDKPAIDRSDIHGGRPGMQRDARPGDIKRTYDLCPPLNIPPNIRQDGEWLENDAEGVRDFLDGKKEFPGNDEHLKGAHQV